MVDEKLKDMTLRLSGIVSESVVDGVGFRMRYSPKGANTIARAAKIRRRTHSTAAKLPI